MGHSSDHFKLTVSLLSWLLGFSIIQVQFLAILLRDNPGHAATDRQLLVLSDHDCKIFTILRAHH